MRREMMLLPLMEEVRLLQLEAQDDVPAEVVADENSACGRRSRGGGEEASYFGV